MTKTLKFFQDQDQDQAWCSRQRPKHFCDAYLRHTEKHFSFSAVNENAEENEISFTAENENENGHSFSAERNENESRLIILVFFFFFLHSVIKSALQCAANTSFSFAFLQLALVDEIPLSSCTVYIHLVAFF